MVRKIPPSQSAHMNKIAAKSRWYGRERREKTMYNTVALSRKPRREATAVEITIPEGIALLLSALPIDGIQ
jgi:hypothetical protein